MRTSNPDVHHKDGLFAVIVLASAHRQKRMLAAEVGPRSHHADPPGREITRRGNNNGAPLHRSSEQSRQRR